MGPEGIFFLVTDLGVSSFPLSCVSKRRYYYSESFTLQKSMSFYIIFVFSFLFYWMDSSISSNIREWSLLIEGLALYIFFSTFTFEVS